MHPKKLHRKIFKNKQTHKTRCRSNWAEYLCQSFPRHTETVCLHPLSFQRTSTQWEFHRALFLLLLLLCRKQRAFYLHWNFWYDCCKLLLHFSVLFKNAFAQIWQDWNGFKMQRDWLVCSDRPLKARLRFYLSNAALVGMLRAKPLTPVCWKYGMQKMLSAMTATESDGLTKKPCLPRIMLRSYKAHRHK